MNEYVIHAKVKNNLLLGRILEQNQNVHEFCVEQGLSPTTVGNLINMREPAVTEDGDWRSMALRLSEIFGVLPDDLFTEEQRTAQLKRNDAYIEMSRAEAQLLQVDPAEAIDRRALVAAIMGKANLSERQRLVLKYRIEDEKTLAEVGEHLQVSGQAVRYIEARALRKLKRAANDIGIRDAEGGRDVRAEAP